MLGLKEIFSASKIKSLNITAQYQNTNKLNVLYKELSSVLTISKLKYLRTYLNNFNHVLLFLEFFKSKSSVKELHLDCLYYSENDGRYIP